MEQDFMTMDFMEDIFCDGGTISKFKEGYKERPSQKEAAKLIANVIQDKDIMLLEGETGFGKSFAYLFPALTDVITSNLKHKVLIVTSGISLQEQLYNKDVPFVKKVLADYFPNVDEKDIKVTLFKGRQNFICNLKASEAGVTDKLADSRYKEIGEFMKRDKSGDLSRLDFVPDPDILENVTCSKPRECVGKQCRFKSECYYDKHKQNLFVSNVIITNYHMLFSDIKIGGGILPKEIDTIILDEAHEVARICRDFSSTKISGTTASYIRNKCSELINLNSEYENIIDTELVASFVNMNVLVFQNIAQMYGGNLESPILISKPTDLPQSFFDLKEDLERIDSQICKCESKLNSVDSEFLSDEDKQLQLKELSVIEDTLDSISNMRYFLVALDDMLKDENNVVWLESVNNNISLNLKQVNIGKTLNENLFRSDSTSIILTSATISTGGDFDYLKEQLGLNLSP